jgi:hypothetical protein
VLMRLVLERSAISIHSLINGLSIDEIEELQISKCIRELKQHFPFAGITYGGFSGVAHTSSDMSLLFLISQQALRKQKGKVDQDLEVAMSLDYIHVLEINFSAIRFLSTKIEMKARFPWSFEKNKWVYRFNKEFQTFHQYVCSMFKLYRASLKG